MPRLNAYEEQFLHDGIASKFAAEAAGSLIDVPVGCDYKAATTVFFVGRVPRDGSIWNVIGVFSSLPLAVAECKTEGYFVGPLTMNAALPPEASSWPGAFYPNA